MGSITIVEASVAARLGAVLGGGSYSLYGFSILQTQLASVLNSSLTLAKLQLGDPVDTTVLATCNEIALNIACRDVLRQCLSGQLAMYQGFNVSGLGVNAVNPGIVQGAVDAFDKTIQDLLQKFESMGGVGSAPSEEYDQDTLGVDPEGE
jgi:hypothetical protein